MIVFQLDSSENDPLDRVRQTLSEAMPAQWPEGTRQRILLCAHEVISNLVRHSQPRPSTIQIDLRMDQDHPVCVLRDDGGRFTNFDAVWTRAQQTDLTFDDPGLGLRMVRQLCPLARYHTQNGWNEFVLPMTTDMDMLTPLFFRAPVIEVVL